MTDDKWDELAKEADLLRGAIITGTLKTRHVELGPDHPRYPDSDAQQSERQRRAHERAIARRRRKVVADEIRVEYGFQSPYPSAAEMYPHVRLQEDAAGPTEEQRREAATSSLPPAGTAPSSPACSTSHPRSPDDH